MIICVDFDGTCVTHEFPNTGLDIGAGPVLKYLYDRGNSIILYTMRDDDKQLTFWEMENTTLARAILWFISKGIQLYGVNENPNQKDWTSSPKPYANLYIDDAGFGCPLMKSSRSKRPFVNWEEIVRVFVTQGIIPMEDSKELIEKIHKETALLDELRRIPYGCTE